jgi:hypothetical protein
VLSRVNHSPAEGVTTKVDFAFHVVRVLVLPERPSSEITKRDASAKEATIADSMVNVLPKPISSARIPPRGRAGTRAFSQVIILCWYLQVSESGDVSGHDSKSCIGEGSNTCANVTGPHS